MHHNPQPGALVLLVISSHAQTSRSAVSYFDRGRVRQAQGDGCGRGASRSGFASLAQATRMVYVEGSRVSKLKPLDPSPRPTRLRRPIQRWVEPSCQRAS